MICATLLCCVSSLLGPEDSKPLVGIDFEHPSSLSSPINWNVMTGPGTLSNLIDETGATTGISVSVSTGFVVEAAVNPAQVPAYSSPLGGVDDYLSGYFKIILQGLQPNTQYELYFFALSNGVLDQHVQMWTGSFDQVAPPGVLLVNILQGSSTQPLAAFGALSGSTPTGGLVFDVYLLQPGLKTVCAGMAIRELPGYVCFADCDESGTLDFFDFLCFQNTFAAGQVWTDCDANGKNDFFDFLCFQNAFVAGCP